MRRCDETFIVYDYWGVSLQQLRDAFRHVAKHEVPQGIFSHYVERFWVDEDNEHFRHIQVQYEGAPFIVARDEFEEANAIVHRFLKSSGMTNNEICRDSTNIFD